MDSKPTQHVNAGTGPDARPGVPDAAAAAPTQWEDWYTNSSLEPQMAVGYPPDSFPTVRASGWRRAAAAATGAAAVVAVFSAGVLFADLTSPHDTAAATTPRAAAAAVSPHPAAPVRAAPPQPTATVTVQAPSNVPVVPRPAGEVRAAPPTRISIPALKIHQRLIGLQVNAHRQLEVPHNYNDIGWWSSGPAAGDRGAAVIVGHVDSTVGPAVFYRLSSLTKGATIAVGRADGTTATFTVTKLQAFSKKHFPDKLVYRTSGKPSLHLVTCGGPYTRSTGYQANVVVFADLVKLTRVAQPKQKAKPTTSAKPSVPATRVPAKRVPTSKAHQARVSPRSPTSVKPTR